MPNHLYMLPVRQKIARKLDYLWYFNEELNQYVNLSKQ